MTTTTSTDGTTPSDTDTSGAFPAASVLPELRTIWWESGIRARADAGLLTVFAELPRLVARALSISWRADRIRTSVVAAVTLGAGVMAAFGLLATQRVLVELFAEGRRPTA